mmetsp:Transcript_17887/g.27015  ORF Transcript_17887/g.27015 Transcript_17887/m.27015 type:complete len:80 (-) Transcript_17887:97-336(-)
MPSDILVILQRVIDIDIAAGVGESLALCPASLAQSPCLKQIQGALHHHDKSAGKTTLSFSLSISPIPISLSLAAAALLS